jgi:hypothetical protein
MTVSSGSWHFGAGWPGERCGAKTRKGTSCLNPAVSGRHRCRMHGGKGGAPNGPSNGNYKHGRYTKENLLSERESAHRFRILMVEAREAGVFDVVPTEDQLWPVPWPEGSRFPDGFLEED